MSVDVPGKISCRQTEQTENCIWHWTVEKKFPLLIVKVTCPVHMLFFLPNLCEFPSLDVCFPCTIFERSLYFNLLNYGLTILLYPTIIRFSLLFTTV